MSANPPTNPFANLAAEQACLGSVLLEERSLDAVAALVDADDFSTDAHQRIFRGMLELRDAGKPLDAVTLTERLASWLVNTNQLADAGNYAYLGELVTSVATGANAEHYVGIVREMSVRRSLARICDTNARKAANLGDDVQELLGDVEREVYKLARKQKRVASRTLSDLVVESMQRLDDRCEKSKRGERSEGLTTGFRDLDAIAKWRAGELVVIAARPSLGKTSLAAKTALRACEVEGIATLFVSLEQSDGEIVDRMIVMESETDSRRFQEGTITPDEESLIPAAARRLGKNRMFFVDEPNLTILQIASVARQHKARESIELLVIDYLGLIEPDNPNANRNEQVSRLSRKLKQLARELDIPVIVLAQLNRQSEGRTDGKPKLSDLRDSGSIEQDADVVILLHRPEDRQPSSAVQQIQAIVAKNRNGPRGTVDLSFRKSCMRFDGWEGDR